MHIYASKISTTRPNDYIYDSTYVVGSKHDHNIAINAARNTKMTLEPIYKNMFSTLVHYPSTQVTLKVDLPSTMPFRFRGGGAKGISGSERCRYFKRPILAYKSNATRYVGPVHYMKLNEYQTLANQVPFPANEPPQKTVSVQTMYRESSAQTDPYSPAFYPTKNEEILLLRNLKYGQGLPIGLREVQVIERARQRRKWERELPNLKIQKRLAVLEALEREEWKVREEEIARLQDARLQILKQLVEDREQENEDLNKLRIEKIWKKKLAERDALVDQLASKRLKEMRKLAKKRNNLDILSADASKKRDIIADYATYNSEVYVKKLSQGRANYNKNPSTVNLQAVPELEKIERGFSASGYAFSRDVLNHLMSEFTDKRVQDRKHTENLNRIRDAVCLHVEKDEIPPVTTLKFVQKLEVPEKRPPTPLKPSISEEEDQKEQSALALQNIIRGRIVQDFMFEGKQRRLQLINELKLRQKVKKARREAGLPEDSGDEVVQRPISVVHEDESGRGFGTISDDSNSELNSRHGGEMDPFLNLKDLNLEASHITGKLTASSSSTSGTREERRLVTGRITNSTGQTLERRHGLSQHKNRFRSTLDHSSIPSPQLTPIHIMPDSFTPPNVPVGYSAPPSRNSSLPSIICTPEQATGSQDVSFTPPFPRPKEYEQGTPPSLADRSRLSKKVETPCTPAPLKAGKSEQSFTPPLLPTPSSPAPIESLVGESFTPSYPPPVTSTTRRPSIVLSTEEIQSSFTPPVRKSLKSAAVIPTGQRKVSHQKSPPVESLGDGKKVISANNYEKLKPISPNTTLASTITYEYLGKTLDFLSKEIVRLREEQLISALVQIAEKKRLEREASETDRRRHEVDIRALQDKIFFQLSEANSESIESLLEKTISDSINATSSEQARIKVSQYSEKINNLVDEIEREEESEAKPKEVVRDLVSGFLFPEVEKSTLRCRVHAEQRKYLMAAHKSLVASLKEKEGEVAKANAELEAAAEARIKENEERRRKTEENSRKVAEAVLEQSGFENELDEAGGDADEVDIDLNEL